MPVNFMNIPDSMPVARAVFDWIASGADGNFGVFTFTGEADEDAGKMSFTIEFDGTPSIYTAGGERLEVSPSVDGVATVGLEMVDDNRDVRVFVDTAEAGFAHCFVYALLGIPGSRFSDACEVANFVNSRSRTRMAFVQVSPGDETLVLRVESSARIVASDKGRDAAATKDALNEISYSALELTHHYWKFFEALASTRDPAGKIIARLSSDGSQESGEEGVVHQDTDADADELPDVFPMTQVETSDDGEAKTRPVRPLTYAMMTFVKGILGEPDTIDIVEDGSFAEWWWPFPSPVSGEVLVLRFRTAEDRKLIFLDIDLNYVKAGEMGAHLRGRLEHLVLETNNRLEVGHIQLEADEVRYHSSIKVDGIASEDPEYRGPHLLPPMLFKNMFDYGRAVATKFVGELNALLDPAASAEGLDTEVPPSRVGPSEDQYRRAVAFARSAREMGATKTVAAEAVFEQLEGASRQMLLKALQEGAGLTAAGASTYLANLRKKR